MASSHALCAGEAAGIYAALAAPRTLTVSRWRVRCHSGRQKVSRRNRAIGRFRRHSAHGARSNVHQATVASYHALCAGEAAGINAALAMPHTLAMIRWRVQCYSGRQNVGEFVHLAVFVVTAPMAPGPMCTKRPWLRPMPCAPAKQQAYT